MRFLPHGLRKEMYEEVLRLYSQGLGYTRIIRKLRARFGVTVSRSTISYWVRGVRTPYYVRRPPAERVEAYRAALAMHAEGLGCKMITRELRRDGYPVGLSTVKDWVAGRSSPYGPEPPELPIPPPRPTMNRPRIMELVPSPELAYVMGAVLGDGSVFSTKITLKAKDIDFVAEFAHNLSVVLQRPVKVSRYRGFYVCQSRSKPLSGLLRKPAKIDKLRKYVEHCERCMAAFIRSFADSEASFDAGGWLQIFNTDLQLLLYVKILLAKLSIDSTGPYRRPRDVLVDRTGKVYLRRKDVYRIYIRRASLQQYAVVVGFTIRRKQRKLERYLRRRKCRYRQPPPPQLSYHYIISSRYGAAGI